MQLLLIMNITINVRYIKEICGGTLVSIQTFYIFFKMIRCTASLSKIRVLRGCYADVPAHICEHSAEFTIACGGVRPT